MQVPTNKASLATQHPDTLLVELAADGTMSLLGDTGVSAAAIAEHPAIQRAINQASPVFITADDAVNLQTFTQMLDTLAALGISNLSVKGLR